MSVYLLCFQIGCVQSVAYTHCSHRIPFTMGVFRLRFLFHSCLKVDCVVTACGVLASLKLYGSIDVYEVVVSDDVLVHVRVQLRGYVNFL